MAQQPSCEALQKKIDSLQKQISRLRKRENALRGIQERLSQIIASFAIPVFVLDNNHIVTHYNN